MGSKPTATIVPWFGGSPAVWTTCLSFFQVTLVLGYAYAHAVTRYVPAKAQLVVYQSRLRPDGILVFNITNTYLDLSGVVEGLARQFGYQAVRIATSPDEAKLLYRTDFIVVTKNQAFLTAHRDQLPAGATEKHSEPVTWTDKYSNIFRILKP